MWQLWEEGAHRRRLQGEEKLSPHYRLGTWTPHLEGEPIPPRRYVRTPIQEAIAISQAKEWLDKGIVCHAPETAWENNLVFVSKSNGKIRVCLDCTPANKVTRDYDWPLPRLQDIRYRIRGSTWFVRFDLKDAFFRLKVPAQYRYLVAFRCGGRAYWFQRMPFGLKTGPAHFQRFMDWGLAAFFGQAVWYMDDILVHGKSRGEVELRASQVRGELRRMGCAINEEKSVGARKSLLFAGLWISGEGVGPNLLRKAEVLALPTPRSKAEAQSALGLVSYLRDFIPLASHFTSQLYPDKNGLRLPPEEYEKQWARLCAHLVSAITTNHHWRDGVPADLYTDASAGGLGAVVIQAGRVVALASRKLTSAETRYSATDREHLGLVYAAERFKVILHQSSTEVKVATDHSALLSRKRAELMPRQARWAEIVHAWIPNLSHVKGKDNPADFISRWGLGTVGAVLRT